jgi:Bax protein|tara:strand:+ start:588 stop:1244 length:657 start_codon:yes stop_codon:yes gene_type:complete
MKRSTKLLRDLYLGLLYAFIIIGIAVASFMYGTGQPNKKVVQELEESFHKKDLEQILGIGLVQPEFMFNNANSFVDATGKCVEYLNFTTDRHSRVPTSIIIAMAGIESGWGTSRFSVQGNNLFGIRTWDLKEPHMKPKDVQDAKFGLKKYATKCDSIKDMIRILNTHTAYTEFRVERMKQIKAGTWNYKKLLLLLGAWSTNPDYHKIILRTIKERNLP